jgi:hypothetical protein
MSTSNFTFHSQDSRTSLEAYVDFNFHLSRLKTSLQAYINFNSHLSEPKTSLQAYINFLFHFSQSRTSLQAYFDFKFYRSQSRTTLEAYFDLNFHISMSRTNLVVYIDLQATASSILIAVAPWQRGCWVTTYLISASQRYPTQNLYIVLYYIRTFILSEIVYINYFESLNHSRMYHIKIRQMLGTY